MARKQTKCNEEPNELIFSGEERLKDLTPCKNRLSTPMIQATGKGLLCLIHL